LVKFFPNISSISEFIKSKDFLGGLAIDLAGTKERLNAISNKDYLAALVKILSPIEEEIKANITEFQGSDYVSDYIRKIFIDKEIRVKEGSEKEDGQEDFVGDKGWYIYNANYETSEEKSFVRLFSKKFSDLKQKFSEIYLIKNEREIKIFDKLGRAFEPDFLLFCKKSKCDQPLIYQVFIEPKGNHLKGFDKWKEDFLNEIKDQKRVIKIETDNYLGSRLADF
jgi:type III restriction enzyme